MADWNMLSSSSSSSHVLEFERGREGSGPYVRRVSSLRRVSLRRRSEREGGRGMEGGEDMTEGLEGKKGTREMSVCIG
jgi:hypothetical protein